MGDPKRRGKKNIKTEQLILYNYSWEKYLIISLKMIKDEQTTHRCTYTHKKI